MPHNFECFTNCGRDHSLDNYYQNNNQNNNNQNNNQNNNYEQVYEQEYEHDYEQGYEKGYEQDYSTDIYIPEDFLEDFSKLKIRIEKNKCVVCHQSTDSVISNSCDSNCTYYCHPECMSRWVVMRLIDSHPYCMICCRNHSMDQIPYLVSDQQMKKTTDDYFVLNYLDFSKEYYVNLYKNLMDYLQYRNIL